MKTEMKKNNKMFLALVVVAALAAVSFAGIALSDNSDAALISNNVVIQPGETSTTDYNFYVEEGDFAKIFEFEVKATGNYTGTISLGTANADRSVYTAYSTLKLTNASAVRITGILYNNEVTGEVISAFMIGNTDKAFEGVLPGGSYELMKGQIVLGAPFDITDAQRAAAESAFNACTNIDSVLSVLISDITYIVANEKIVSFCGTISAGGASVTSSYSVGTMISLPASGDARISSLYMSASPNEALPQDPITSDYPAPEDRTLSISGKASIQYPEVVQRLLDRNMANLTVISPTSVFASDFFMVDSLYVTVEDGAEITAGDRTPSMAETVQIYADTGSTVSNAYLISGNGKVYPFARYVAGGVEFDYVPLGSYTLILGFTTGLEYYGTATVTASGISIGPNQLSATGMVSTDIGHDAVEMTLTYAVADYNPFIFALNMATAELGTAVKDADGFETGAIEFPSGVSTTHVVFVVMKAAAAGSPMRCFYGVAGTNGFAGLIGVKTTSGAPGTDQIKGGDVAMKNTRVRIISNDASHFLIKGEVNVLYNSATNFASMNLANGDAYLNFEGEGILSYGVPEALYPAEPLQILGGTNAMTRIVAAYFYLNEGSPVTKSTYYFTTLEKALTMSNDITLNGKHVILKDTTFDNPAFTEIKITLGPGAILEIGKIKDADGPAISAILTIPAKTKVIVPTSAGDYAVINGQAVYDVKPVPSAYEPRADVLITRTSPVKFIYTDIATGLDISVSGDVLDLRQNATLFRDATLKDGVTLNDIAGGGLIIEEDVILTVNGTLNSKFARTMIYGVTTYTTANMLIFGTLRVNNVVNFNPAASLSPVYVYLGGTIDIMAAGEVNLKNNISIWGEPLLTDGTMIVAGKLNAENAATVSIGTLILTGTANIASTADVWANDILQIGAQPTLSPMSGTYTNTAVLNGIIGLSFTATAYVYGDFAIYATGTNQNIDVGTYPLVKTEYRIEDKLYVTLYAGDSGSTTPFLPILYEYQLIDIIIKGWNNERYLHGDPLVKNTYYIGETDWEIVYADWEFRQYEVTFWYLQGMTWVCNGLDKDGGIKEKFDYGTILKVSGVVQPGYAGTPVLRANGSAYTAGTDYKVTGNIVFTATGVELATEDKDDGGLTLIEILLIIIVIIIAVIALIIAVRLLRS